MDYRQIVRRCEAFGHTRRRNLQGTTRYNVDLGTITALQCKDVGGRSDGSKYDTRTLVRCNREDVTAKRSYSREQAVPLPMVSGLTHSVRYLLKSDAVTVVVAEQGVTASRSHDTLITGNTDSITCRLYRFNNHHHVAALDGYGNCTKSARADCP